MRLSEGERNSILEALDQIACDYQSLYLFGSRTDNSKKGGDIDLLVVFKNKDELVKFKRLEFLLQIKKRIGERKIDLTLATNDELASDPFLSSILSSAIILR